MHGSGRRNTGPSGYRAVSAGSNVDESLFSGNGVQRKRSGAKQPTSSINTISRSDVSRLAGQAIISGGSAGDGRSLVLTQSELERIRGEMVVQSDDYLRKQKKDRQAELDEQRAGSNARKEKMMQIEAERKKKQPPSEMEVVRRKETNAMLSSANKMREENMDEVKAMNQMMLAAKCVQIRDAQIHEKKSIKQAEADEERRQDILMEIERLKTVKFYQDREIERAAKQKEDALVIQQQIRAREQARILEEERLEQEKQQMLAQIRKNQEEEVQAEIVRKEKGRLLLNEVQQANKDSIKAKAKRVELEREEDRRIQRYIKMKELEEREREEAELALKAEKEAEVAKLRAQQEKAADKQAEIDALRARRAQDSKDRADRAREEGEKKKQADMMADLLVARQKQAEDKLRAKARQIAYEKNEFQRILREQKEAQEEENRLIAAKQRGNVEFAKGLQSQIVENEASRRIARDEKWAEGAKIKRDQAIHDADVQRIREEKVQGLLKSGVQDIYTTELRTKKPGNKLTD